MIRALHSSGQPTVTHGACCASALLAGASLLTQQVAAQRVVLAFVSTKHAGSRVRVTTSSVSVAAVRDRAPSER